MGKCAQAYEKGMTQKELSEETKIYQADINKIERGLSNIWKEN